MSGTYQWAVQTWRYPRTPTSSASQYGLYTRNSQRVSSLQHQLCRLNSCQVLSISSLQLIIIGLLCSYYVSQSSKYLFIVYITCSPGPLYLSHVTNSETLKFSVLRPKRSCAQRHTHTITLEKEVGTRSWIFLTNENSGLGPVENMETELGMTWGWSVRSRWWARTTKFNSKQLAFIGHITKKFKSKVTFSWPW